MLVQLLVVIACKTLFEPCKPADAPNLVAQNNTLFDHVSDIPLPGGYRRIPQAPGSFGFWLRAVKLKTDKTVYLYNGSRKINQQAQYAVLDIPVGTGDLQQCADAVMALRAMYLRSLGKTNEIDFTDNNGKHYRCPEKVTDIQFRQYLERVYSYCGTASLEKQLKPLRQFSDILPGDVLIKGGYPGHAVIVMDVAVNISGRRLYMVAQSYMPAQSVHILKNPAGTKAYPWYEVKDEAGKIVTPEWVFKTSELRRW